MEQGKINIPMEGTKHEETSAKRVAGQRWRDKWICRHVAGHHSIRWIESLSKPLNVTFIESTFSIWPAEIFTTVWPSWQLEHRWPAQIIVKGSTREASKIPRVLKARGSTRHSLRMVINGGWDRLDELQCSQVCLSPPRSCCESLPDTLRYSLLNPSPTCISLLGPTHCLIAIPSKQHLSFLPSTCNPTMMMEWHDSASAWGPASMWWSGRFRAVRCIFARTARGAI